MRNITLFVKKKFWLLLPLLIFSFSACVDKDGESDLNPKAPTKVADQEDDDSGGNGSNTKYYPIFSNSAAAFPGAEGYGKEATGGRGCEIVHVTNLNDNGPGSFRDAVSQPYRTIVFDVSGVIKLSTTVLVLKSNQTILGQTAPGDGIVLYGGRVSASGAENVIVRYLRMRMGAGFTSQADACGIANGKNMIFDHCSITWGKDENFSINPDNKGTRPHNITIQNSIIGQGLQNHSCGGLIQTSTTEGITIYRNLYIDNDSRNPKVKGLNQFVNNVVYNWGTGAAYNMGGDSSGESETTIENNYFIVGLSEQYIGRDLGSGVETIKESYNPARPFTGGNADFKTYFAGNYYDSNKDASLNGVELTQANWGTYCSGSPTFLTTRSDLHPIIAGQTSAEKAYEWIAENAGASLPARDQVDTYLIDELKSLGTKGTIIRNETNTTQFPLGGPGVINSGEKPLDTDGDGIPDEFEDKWGLDKNDDSDARLVPKKGNGYSHIENYALSLEYPDKY
ncbi:polysaccharide lyase family 1 protein [Bacteroides sp. 224]|uniref:pectate lyase family protein n=1 Tax=Bacteroides sp. 224 TaxID=2302936 RepID=UPI0013D6BDBE|nr:pectate lyase [Bacteroides sp. 224]NDV65347.1 pectate lyase [Bacteroides sp. 224]